MKGDRTTLDFTIFCLSAGTVLPGDDVVLMHSINITCPQVGAICYPHFMG
jgi:hypothetical protein